MAFIKPFGRKTGKTDDLLHLYTMTFSLFYLEISNMEIILSKKQTLLVKANKIYLFFIPE